MVQARHRLPSPPPAARGGFALFPVGSLVPPAWTPPGFLLQPGGTSLPGLFVLMFRLVGFPPSFAFPAPHIEPFWL